MSRRVRVAILYGGRSAEHEISVLSARCVMEAIDRDRFEVVPIAITKAGRWLLPERGPGQLPRGAGALPGVEEAGRALALVRDPSGPALVPLDRPGEALGQVDVVFPLLHGPCGEDGTVQGLLELAGTPYVGAGVSASALGMDKELQKLVFSARGIPVARFSVVHERDWRGGDRAAIVDAAVAALGLPCFSKPANLGSSVGISKCRSPAELSAGIEEALGHDRKAIIEEAIEGRELECGVLGNDRPEASGVGEIVAAREFYDYEAKYLVEGSKTMIPAPVPPEVEAEVRRLALEAFRAIGCAGLARIDFFWVEGSRLVLNEINTMPGFTPISMYPKLWEAAGIGYSDLIGRLIDLGLERGRR
ncbi:MAG: D-alanine--D-alanine ligase [Acidobacteria bacterium]|nr:D-alanine--D-alanine ligase [Acidobacteriota bacterium]